MRAALEEAEKELESNCYWMAPTDLQHWLQYTFELEQQHFTAKQNAAQKQFGSAKEAVCIQYYGRFSKISNTSCLPKRPRQTGQTQIRQTGQNQTRLLLKKQSDQSRPCLLFG